jgi:DNA repair exonuclease SbcCD ATPase subunit
MYSGGERKIIIIATFLAMIQLSNERGLGVNLAAIDELDEHLDDVNTDKLVEAFEAIVNAVPTCLVISHNSRLLNTMTFDETWTVHKKNEFSTVRIGEARMAA